MIKNETPYFIDFQGGMKGPIQYDLASLLWQAKAQLPAEWKNELLHFYMKEVSFSFTLLLSQTIYVSSSTNALAYSLSEPAFAIVSSRINLSSPK